MKRTIFTIALSALSMSAMAQETEIACTDSTVFVSSDRQMPEFKGGQEALKKFLAKNVRYPDAATAYGVEGSVVMTFIVGEDGTLSDISAHDCKIERFNTTKFSQETENRQNELKKQFALLFAKEGARAIRKMPKWTPGTLNGKPVRVRYNLRIRFIDPSK